MCGVYNAWCVCVWCVVCVWRGVWCVGVMYACMYICIGVYYVYIYMCICTYVYGLHMSIYPPRSRSASRTTPPSSQCECEPRATFPQSCFCSTVRMRTLATFPETFGRPRPSAEKKISLACLCSYIVCLYIYISIYLSSMSTHPVDPHDRSV